MRSLLCDTNLIDSSPSGIPFPLRHNAEAILSQSWLTYVGHHASLAHPCLRSQRLHDGSGPVFEPRRQPRADMGTGGQAGPK